MNYDDLEKALNSSVAYGNNNDELILEHFKKRFEMVQYDNTPLFVFHHEREFFDKNHIVTLHSRCNGKIPLHIYHYILITYVYSGSLSMTLEQQKITLNKGDIIVLDRHVPHGVDSTGPDDLAINIVINDDYFTKKFINRLPSNNLMARFILELMNSGKSHTHYLVFDTNQDEKIHNAIQNILCEYFDYNATSDDIIDNYIMILITYLARTSQSLTNISSKMFKNQQLLDDILEYIKDNYKDGNLKTMCEQFGYNPSYTSKLIKKFAGKTFKQLVNEQRMKHANILLQNKELPIYDIAEAVGFNNLTSFYKKFAEFNHCTPKEYREQLK